MNIKTIQEKYNIRQDDARSPQEKRAKISALLEATEQRKISAENRGNDKDFDRANRRSERLFGLGTKMGRWWTVYVSGTFQDKVRVSASSEREAEKQATTLVLRTYPKLRLNVTSTKT